MQFLRIVAAGILLAAVGGSATAAPQSTTNPWKAAEQATLDAAVAKRDFTLILRLLASSVASREYVLAMVPIAGEVRHKYRGRECEFYDEITNADFSTNPYFTPAAAEIVANSLPAEYQNPKVIGKLASYLAYTAGTGDPPACVCDPMPVDEVAMICRDIRFYPALPQDQARYKKALSAGPK